MARCWLADNLQIQGGGDIVMLSGLRGKTMVCGNRITSNGLVWAALNTWGVCEVPSNQVKGRFSNRASWCSQESLMRIAVGGNR